MGRVKGTWWLSVFVAGGLVLSAGCSSGGSSSSAPTTEAGTAAGVVSSRSTATTGAPSANATGLSGTWAGDYRQTTPSSTSGTFTIEWQQSGSNLTGTIKIPGVCPSGCPITATVNGNNVKFGVVEAGSIDYSGTVSGNTMSGTYATADGASKGTWSATKS